MDMVIEIKYFSIKNKLFFNKYQLNHNLQAGTINTLYKYVYF